MGEKIVREINILNHFKHPHIIRLYEVQLTYERVCALRLSLGYPSVQGVMLGFYCAPLQSVCALLMGHPV